MKSSKDAEAALEGKESFPRSIKYYRSLFYYTKDSDVAEMIHRVKYNGQYRIARYLGSLLAEQMIKEGDWTDFTIIPVPIHWKRRKARGFNQAEEIAKGVIKVIDIPIDNQILKRTGYENSQTGKDKLARSEVLRSAFGINKDISCPKKIILVDDVVTTGSTIGACLNALESLDPISVSVVSIGVSI